ncbi:hypothetical protein PG989_004610 [Apiospora arundinis]
MNLRNATYNGNLGWDVPQLACIDSNKNPQSNAWRNCKAVEKARNDSQSHFFGCCQSDACVEGDICALGKMGSARFSNSKNQEEFLRIFGPSTWSSSPSSPPSPSATVGTSTPPDGNTASTSSGPTGQAKTPEIAAGSAAGIAIGCAVAGLVLGALAAFFLLRRRRRRTAQPEQVHMSYAPGKGEDLAHSMAGGDNMQLSEFLLSPKPDNEIVSDLRALDSLIRQHVENNYHLHPIQQSPKSLAQALTTLGLSGHSQRSPDDIARLTIDARTRVAALQHVITRVALQSTTLSSGSGALVSMLPPSVAAFMHSVPATERHRGNAEAMSTAMTKWRQLSAFLLHPNRSDRTPLLPSEEGTAPQAQQLAKELNRFLETFVVRGRELNYEQENHLSQVLAECARFGYLLFSQPAEYRFNYDSHGRRGGIVVCPGLERVADGEGRQYSKPQVLSAPVEDP